MAGRQVPAGRAEAEVARSATIACLCHQLGDPGSRPGNDPLGATVSRHRGRRHPADAPGQERFTSLGSDWSGSFTSLASLRSQSRKTLIRGMASDVDGQTSQ